MTEEISSVVPNVIEASLWLRERIEAMVASGDVSGAIGYLVRLQSSADEPETRMYCQRYLGILYLIDKDLVRASEALNEAYIRSPEEPYISYALGHCEAKRNPWRAALSFFEAIHAARDGRERAEFMRSAADMMQRVGNTEMAHEMMLGALEQDIGNPWILNALSHLYEEDGRWMDTLEILGDLERALKSVTQAMVIHQTPSIDELLRTRLLGELAGERELRERAAAINKKLRARIDLVYDERERRSGVAEELMPTNFPNALHILVRELGHHERSQPLLASAQSLWARTRHERFDVMLTPNTLAASIHWLVERLHWRLVTPGEELCRVYDVDAERVQAAVRILVERFQIRFLEHKVRYSGLRAAEVERLDRIQRAILYGVELRSLDVAQGILG